MPLLKPPTAAALDDPYAGLRVTVMGLGHFGGGIGAVRFLARHRARVTVTDLKSAGELAQSLEELRDVPLAELRLGEHREEDFTSAHLVVASPAVRPNHPCLVAARRSGVPVTTEVGLFWTHCPASIIGVTGTVGKSTTAALIHHMLSFSGRRCWLGGNIGGSLLDHVTEMRTTDWVVLELSSFQLMYLDAEARSPQIAVVTNFHRNHLDWHASVDEYRTAKQTLLRHQQGDDAAILPAGDAEPGGWITHGRRIEFQAQHAPDHNDTSPALSGGHNCSNIAAAIGAATAAGVDPATCRSSLASFRSLPHRLEFVGESQGRRFYNDSKATTPEAAIAALHAFNAPLIVLAGGSDKGVDLQLLAAELHHRAKAVALLGETAPLLDRILAAASPPDARAAPSRCVAADFPSAFAWAMSESAPGDIILLSPGCASFGWFRDYADRGDQFRKLVEGLRS